MTSLYLLHGTNLEPSTLIGTITEKNQMSTNDSSAPILKVQLELLRLRASLERRSLVIHSQQLRLQLSPHHWVDRASDLTAGQVAAKGFSLAAQFPYLTSAVASMLVRRRCRALAWAGLSLVVWRMIYITKESNKSDNFRPRDY